ncbi:MAG: E3 binding domain-containing protein, partial [Candidatus Eisenbacteria bacterium]|nr:E3 binding domain-containing protein [Candidatus Eisenbacteria bacterium]
MRQGTMKVDMVMPQMGESIAEGTVLKWLKKVGDHVEKDENVLEISTDKVDSEIPSPVAGTIVELKAGEGDVIPVGQVIAILDTEAKAGAGDEKPKSEPAASGSGSKAGSSAPEVKTETAARATPAAAPSSTRSTAPAPSARATGGTAASHAPSNGGTGGGGIPRQDGDRFYSPLVRSIAREEGVSLSELQSLSGSGRGGRVTKDDLLSYVDQ